MDLLTRQLTSYGTIQINTLLRVICEGFAIHPPVSIQQKRCLTDSMRFMLMSAAMLILLFTGTLAQAVPITAFEPGHFTRQNGAPVTEKRSFFTEHLNGVFVLTVYNGGLEDDAAIGKFVSSSTITLNGVVVVGPQNFNQNTSVVSVPVSLSSANELAVQLQGKPGGVVTVEITGHINHAPFADAGINQTVEVGSSVTLNGSGSSDEDGDSLNYQWQLIAKPSTSLATLADADSSSASFTADVPGNYVAGLIVNDGQLDSAESQVTISALEPNEPPVLDPIGHRTVPLGTTLTLNLSAADPDGDQLNYSALELPLPEGAELDGVTGEFTYKPVLEHIGSFDLTFTVSDGFEIDSETITLTVPNINEAHSTRFSSRLLDANDYSQGIVTPIVGATVSFLDSSQSVMSDSNGYIHLSNLPAGTQVLDIDTSTALLSPGGEPYAGFREQFTLIDHVDNVVERPFYLPRIDMSSLTAIDPNQDTVVNNDALGVSLTVLAHTAKNPDGSDYTGDLSISLVPEGFEPVSMPEYLGDGQLITIQPVGITFSTPAPITFPNRDNLPPGSEVDIWSVDPEMGVFVIVGTGTVSADGQTIETVSGGIVATDWHDQRPPALDNASQAGSPNCNSCKNTQDTSSTLTTQTGELSTTIALPDYYSQGQNRSQTLVYSSQRAWPAPVIPFDATVVKRSAVPNQISHQATLGGVKQGNRIYQSTTGLEENKDESLRMVSAFDASQLATGIYPYTVNVTNHFNRSSRTASLSDKLIVVNEQTGAFGAGWGLSGLSRLKEHSDGRVLIYDGNGDQTLYDRVKVNLGLDQWQQEGATNAGDWEVASDGLSVIQNINGSPTFFVSREDLFNTTITGRFSVETTRDDDFFGLVFGYKKPIANNGDNSFDSEFLVFDWKKKGQKVKGWGTALAGFTLAHVKGQFDSLSDLQNALWDHNAAGKVTVLAKHNRFDAGWEHNEDYEYELTYTANRVIIKIDGVTIFDVSGQFEPGRFGFYNFNQLGIRYEHFFNTSDFESLAGDHSTLKRNDDGSYTRTLKNGTEIDFDADGLQTAVTDRNDNSNFYSYDAEQRLIAITDPVGLQTQFNYLGEQLDTITDPVGRITRFQYDNDNNLIKVTFPDGNFKRYGYDHRHLMTTESDERGMTGVREYGSSARIKQVTRSDGSLHTANHEHTIGLVTADSGFGTSDNPAPVVRPNVALSFFTDGNNHTEFTKTDALGRLIWRTDANGLTTQIDRDADGNPIKTIRPDQSEVTRTYGDNGNRLSTTEQYNGATTVNAYEPQFNLLTSVKDARNHTTVFSRNPANGNLDTVTNALGHQTNYQYNSAGQIKQITDANGLVTTYAYNAQGLPETVTETPPAGGGLVRVTTMTYTPAGQIETITAPDNIVQTLAYDDRGRIIGITDHLNQQIEYRYDNAGNRTRINTRESDGTLTSTLAQTYDALNRLRTAVQPHISGQDSIQQTDYDGDGNLIGQIDPKQQETVQEYDPGNRLERRIDALLGTTHYDYDDNGYLKQVIAPNGAQTDYDIDPLGRIKTETSPDRGELAYTYDLNNNLKTLTDARGITRVYDYDALNRLIAISFPDPSENVILDYDNCPYGISRLCAVSDQAGDSQLSYDAYGNITDIVESRDGVSYHQSYQYDIGHRIETLTLPTSRVVNYQRDQLQRIVRITTTVSGNSQIILDNIAYNANNQIVEQTFGNGLTETRRYDLQGRLLNINLDSADQTSLSYDANSNILSRNTGIDQHSYQYDGLDRLEQETNNGDAIGYQYDANGNRREKTAGNQTTQYDIVPDSNQLSAIDSQLLSHDDAGNLTHDGLGRSYHYNDAGRLKSIQQNGQTLAEYRYNNNGQRSHKITGVGTIHYHYDLSGNLIAETQADGTPIKDYLWHQGSPIAQIDGDGVNDTLNYLHTDHLLTPRLATDSNQTVTWKWEGEAFGNTPPQSVGATVNLRFPGQYFDGESGLYSNWNRYYDPTTGRYITSDPELSPQN